MAPPPPYSGGGGLVYLSRAMCVRRTITEQILASADEAEGRQESQDTVREGMKVEG